MDAQLLMRHLLRTPATYRTTLIPTRPFSHAPSLPGHARYLSTPSILRPSFWASMIPKPFRSRPTPSTPRDGWNPATPYIILGLLVGSQAIQILWLKQERAHALRKAEAKIGLLKEVIERVQSGEEVDVERLLGTGDEQSEREWAEVLREVREEEELFQSKKRRRAERVRAKEEGEKKVESGLQERGEEVRDEGLAKVESVGGVKFY